MGENLYVLDSQKDTVTVFVETDFGKIVHKATALHNAGYYEEALDPWYEVLKHDGNYRRAYVGVASALLRKGDYEGSMKYAELADSPRIYNKAFEGYRMDWLKAHFGQLILGLALIAVGLFMLARLAKKKKAAELAQHMAQEDAAAEAEHQQHVREAARKATEKMAEQSENEGKEDEQNS